MRREGERDERLSEEVHVSHPRESKKRRLPEAQAMGHRRRLESVTKTKERSDITRKKTTTRRKSKSILKGDGDNCPSRQSGPIRLLKNTLKCRLRPPVGKSCNSRRPLRWRAAIQQQWLAELFPNPATEQQEVVLLQ